VATVPFEIRLELHGDRASGDPPEVRGGFTWLGRERYVVLEFGEGDLSDAGARKATRLIRLAEQTKAPVLVLGRLEGEASPVFQVVRALRSARVRVVLVGNEWGALANESHVEVLPAIPSPQ